MVDLLLQRGNELALAEEALAAARAGEGRLVVFEGPSGIGKTRMLAEGADLAAGCGFEVQDARGDELETGFAYGIIRQLASPVLRDPDPGTRAAVADGPGALVAALLDPMQLTADAPRQRRHRSRTASTGSFESSPNNGRGSSASMTRSGATSRLFVSSISSLGDSMDFPSP